MDENEIRTVIYNVFKDIFAEHVPKKPFPDFKPETVLFDTGLDSLGFAIIVSQLEEDLGFDPFTMSDDAFYPTTYKDFVDYYIKNKP